MARTPSETGAAEQQQKRKPTPCRILLYARQRLDRAYGEAAKAEWLPMVVTHVHDDGTVDGVVLTAWPARTGWRSPINVIQGAREGDRVGCWQWPQP